MPKDSFEHWLHRAETICVNRAGLDLARIGDGLAWYAWTDGIEPVEYVLDLMADAGIPAPPSNGRLTKALADRKVLGYLPILY